MSDAKVNEVPAEEKIKYMKYMPDDKVNEVQVILNEVHVWW